MRPSTSRFPVLRSPALPALVAALAVVAAVLVLPTTSAAFRATTTNPANSLAADRLQPPSGLTATQSCPTSTIVHVSVSTAAGASSLQLPTPPGVSPGDVLVAQIGHKGSATITPPAGWTSIRRDIAYRSDNFPQVTSALFWRVVVTGEPSSATFSLGSAVEMVGGIAAYRGVSTVDAVNASGGRTGTGTTATTPSVTTTVANTMLVDFTTKWQEDLPAPAGTQQRWKLMSGTGTAHLGVSAGDVTATGTGATATRSSASQTNSSTEWAAQTIALRPTAQQPAATLSWTASPSSWATGYKGERIVGGTVQATHTVPIGTTTVTDTGLVNGTTYTYRVWAYRGAWVSTAVTTTLTPSC
ncbi:fibronectin type III domain-containing protein [Geodermatophilus obscurus]|uniref:Fibronectin type III domain protein n=1 Tax=Geodermatophilus obscurus (strain ATCC 25078 / DSM 43160 / JCM 3152 / CCUG 61914 / KCC A-0152 / KCTC 9177 / NBRC 13315 / NRRL B-3577 / G-20) TaxID=526225 RepID=D2S913_GEOOG|nr:fibronectin type III domain-containing protein [Geodermatophilus obscurus]ADB73656.1 Fibronectin type III domain protein [Geodermatophilus obscurus DSM 43160]